MKFLISIMVLLLCSNAYSQCAWDSDVATRDGRPAAIESNDCFETDSLSSIRLESADCKCLANVFIVCRPTPCDPACQSVIYVYSIIGIGAGDGSNRISRTNSGVYTPGNTPPLIVFYDSITIECDSPFAFNFTGSCACDDGVNPDVIICSDTDALCEFFAMCNQECDINNPPEDVEIH